MNPFLSGLYILGLFSGYMVGMSHLRMQAEASGQPENPPRFFPYTTLVVTLAVAVPTILQFLFPSLLPLLQRDTERILAGEWWRLFTSLFVQDGGVNGSLFNLVGLALVGSVAERLWGSRCWLILFFGGGILSQLVALFWQPVGAGNSVANFSLAAGIEVLCLMVDRLPSIRNAALLGLLTGGLLLWLRDIHGAAILLGAILAFLLLRLNRNAGTEVQDELL